MGNKTLSALKKQLDKIFSVFVRMRTADEQGYVTCFTCDKKDHWKKLQCGHFQSRRYLPTRFHEQNCQVQCVKCNMFMQGQQYAFSKLLDLRYQEGTSERLERLSRTTVKFMRCDYDELIKEYTAKVQLLTQGIDN